VKTDFSDFRLIEENISLTHPHGSILVKIEKFAFTANNITYAVLGKLYHYFDFFTNPASSDQNYGVIPVWGIGLVITSQNKDIQVGERIYGYFPMALYAILTPEKVQASGFNVNRDHLPPEYSVYHFYNFLKNDALTENLSTEQENLMILYRPLFLTSFLLDDYLAQTITAPQVIISSASSKTAFSLAFLLKLRKTSSKVIGLTSSKNQNFVTKLQIYDQVIPYNSITSIPRINTTYIDISGDPKHLDSLIEHLGQDLIKMSISVGLSHWDSFTKSKGQPVKSASTSQVFFAPVWYKKRHEELGSEFTNRMRVSMGLCIKQSNHWTKLIDGYGPHKIKEIYQMLLKGDTLPEDGYICSLSETKSKF